MEKQLETVEEQIATAIFKEFGSYYETVKLNNHWALELDNGYKVVVNGAVTFPEDVAVLHISDLALVNYETGDIKENPAHINLDKIMDWFNL